MNSPPTQTIPSQLTSRSRWALGTLFSRLWLSWKTGWASLPPDAGRRWFFTLLAGCLIVNLLEAGIVIGARRLEASGALFWETAFLKTLVERLPLSYYQGSEFGLPGGSMLLWPLMIFAAGMAIAMKRPIRALSLVVGYAMVSVTVVLGWAIWDRPRPTFVHNGLAAPEFNSFPSGHAAHVIMAYGLLAWFWTRSSRSFLEKLLAALFVLFMLLLTSAGRLRIGAHWPSDIVAGTLIGAAWLLVLILAIRRAERL